MHIISHSIRYFGELGAFQKLGAAIVPPPASGQNDAQADNARASDHLETDVEKIAEPIRVLVVDDHPTVRQGLGRLLEPEGITVCAEAANCADALASIERHHPDMALVDLSLGDEDGVTLIAGFHKQALPSLAYSIHEDGQHVRRAIAAGALGYVSKSEVHLVLVDAIFEVAAGRRFVSPKAAEALAEHDS